MGNVIFIVVAFGAMYALMILPQQRRVRRHQELLASLVVGDEILCASGIYGTIRGFEGANDEIMQVEVADGVIVLMNRSAVSEVAVDEVLVDDDPTDPGDEA